MMVPMLSGHPDFDRALALANSIPEPMDRAWTLAEIGKRQGHMGVDPILVVEALREIKASLGPSFTRNLDWNLASVLAAAGSFRQAEIHVAATEQSGTTLPLRYLLAREKVERGIDPTPDLDVVRGYIDSLRHQSPSSGTTWYAELATVSYETTKAYPSSDLAQAEVLLDDYERQYPTDRLVSGWHGDVAKAFASCGNFKAAHDHEQKILGHSPIETTLIRTRTLRHIAEQKLQFGEYQGVAETAREAIQLVTDTPAEPAHLVPHLLHEQTSGIGTLWPLVGTAEAKLGVDPQPSFQLTEETIQKIGDGYWTARALATLAHAKKASGRDPNLSMNRAWLTLIDMPRQQNYDVIDRLQRADGFAELAGAFIELGDLGSAREMLADLERVGSEDDLLDVTSDVAVLLADLAVAEMKRGGLP